MVAEVTGAWGSTNSSDDIFPEERESFWIFTLRMLSPHRLNLDE